MDELLDVFVEQVTDELMHGSSEYFVVLGHTEINSIPMNLYAAKTWMKSLESVFPTEPVYITRRSLGQHN